MSSFASPQEDYPTLSRAKKISLSYFMHTFLIFFIFHAKLLEESQGSILYHNSGRERKKMSLLLLPSTPSTSQSLQAPFRSISHKAKTSANSAIFFPISPYLQIPLTIYLRQLRYINVRKQQRVK